MVADTHHTATLSFLLFCGRILIMNAIGTFLPYIQLTIAALLVVCILLQKTGASLGGAFGADNFSSGFHTRRGAEKVLFQATIVFAILFALSAFASFVI